MIQCGEDQVNCHFCMKRQSPLLILEGGQINNQCGEDQVNFHFCMKRQSPLLILEGGQIND